jgi:hypothetical protein
MKEEKIFPASFISQVTKLSPTQRVKGSQPGQDFDPLSLCVETVARFSLSMKLAIFPCYDSLACPTDRFVKI